MATDYARKVGDAEVIVFASTFEEATFADGLDRDFTFLDTGAIPSVSGYAVEWLAAPDLYYKVTINGAGITDTDPAKVDIYFGGTKQEVLSVAADKIEVKLTGVNSGSTANTFEVYLSEGVPDGWHDPTLASPTMFDAGITFDPKLLRLSTSEGTGAGAVIYAEIAGAGMDDKYTLVDGDSDEVCETATMRSYSLLECQTKSKEYATATTFGVKNTATSAAAYGCGNTDTTACQYTTLSTAATPSYTGVVLSADTTTLTFTGVLLDTYGTGSICDVKVLGIAADSCAVDSAT